MQVGSEVNFYRVSPKRNPGMDKRGEYGIIYTDFLPSCLCLNGAFRNERRRAWGKRGASCIGGAPDMRNNCAKAFAACTHSGMEDGPARCAPASSEVFAVSEQNYSSHPRREGSRSSQNGDQPPRRRRKSKKKKGGALRIIGTLLLIFLTTSAFLACFGAVYIVNVILPQASMDLSSFNVDENSVMYYQDKSTGEYKELRQVLSVTNSECCLLYTSPSPRDCS